MNTNPHRRPRLIGILDMAAPDPERLTLWELFTTRLRELEHLDNEDIAFRFCWGNGRQDRLAETAAELVRTNVDVLVTAGTPAAVAACNATSHIPIVMATGVAIGTQLAEATKGPNANVTGISDLPPGVSARRLQLLCIAVGDKPPLAILADRANPSSPLAVQETQETARGLGTVVRDYWVTGTHDLPEILSTMKTDGIGGFVVAPGAMFFAQRRVLAALARDHGIASMSVRREYAEAGCLMAYGARIRENYCQAAEYVSRILNGTMPANIPLNEPTEFDFVINLKTSRAIGLTVPPSLLNEAETIEP